MHWWVDPNLYNDNVTVSHWALGRRVKLNQKHGLLFVWVLSPSVFAHTKKKHIIKVGSVWKEKMSRISKERVESCPGIVSKEFQLHLDEINLTYLDNVCDSQQKDICCVSSTFLSLFSIISVCISMTVIEKHKNVKENKQKSATECNSNTDVSGF